MTRSRISLKTQTIIDEPTVNLTPLIDVVFVILIIFIVIAPLLELDQVELASKGQMSSSSVQEKSPITIHVHSDNTVLFNNQPVTFPELITLLKHAKNSYPTMIPQVFHDRRAQFGTYQEVKNSAEEAGFSELSIILNPA